MLTRQPRETPPRARLRDVRVLLPMLRRHVVALAGAAALTVLAACLGFALPAAVGVLVDQVLAELDAAILWRVVGAVAAATVVLHLAGCGRDLLVSRVAEGVKQQLGDRVMRHLLRLDREQVRRRDPVRLTEKVVGDVNQLDGLLAGALIDLAEQLATVATGVALLLYLSPLLTAVALAVLPLLILVHAASIPGVARRASAVRERRALLMTAVLETLSSLSLIQQCNAEHERSESVAGVWRGSSRANVALLSFLSAAGAAGGVVSGLGPLVVVGAGVALVLDGAMTLGQLVTFVAALGVLFGPIQHAAGIRRGMETALVSLGRVMDLLEREPRVKNPLRDAVVPSGPGCLVFDNVGYAYDDGPPVLSGVDLTVSPGRVTALVGPSGHGKSTLASLLVRADDPACGRIRLDGVDLRDHDLQELRRAVALVPQDPSILRGTLRDNIAMGRPDVDLPRVQRAARLAGADGFIRRLPLGYDQPVGPGGMELSGGQQQRVALARALVRDARVLVLDEPTSALDPIGERHLMGTLRSLAMTRTVLLITHRASTLMAAEEVAVVVDGSIHAHGAHEDLLRWNEEYRRIWQGVDAA